MKRHRSLVALIATLTIIFSQSVCFAWTTGTSSSSYYVADGNKVETSINSVGQTVYRVYQITNGQKTLIQEVFARGLNIWNNTTSVLLANGINKSASYCGFDRNLNVYGIDGLEIATKFKYGFTKLDEPERLTEHPGAEGFKYDDDGFIVGIYTRDGLFDIKSEQIVDDQFNSNFNWNLNFDDNSEYPYILQDGNEYECHVYPNKSCTYVLSSGRLSLNGHLISNNVNPDIQCGINGYLVYTTYNQAYIVRMGTYNSQMLCNNLKEFIYQGDRVRGAKDTYGKSYWISSYSNDYNGFVEFDDYQGYPQILQDGNYYYFNKNSYNQYKYELNGSSNLYGWNSSGIRKYIAGDVDYIVFSNEYMFYVTGSTAKGVKLGSTSTTKTYSRFIDFEYDDNGIVTAVITSNGTTWVE